MCHFGKFLSKFLTFFSIFQKKMKISSRSKADLIRCVDCICSSILKNELNISDLLDDGDNLFYLNSDDEKLPVPKSVIIAFQRLYLKLNVILYFI